MDKLVGQNLESSATITDLLDRVVGEAEKINQVIQGPRPPSDQHKDYGAKLVAEVSQLRGRPLFYPFVGSGAGYGVYVELTDGSVKIDLINGIGIHIFGHGHPRVHRATLRGALSDTVVQGNLQMGPEYLSMARKLIEIASRKSRLKHTWITTCGSMANENALKMVRQKHTPARKILAFQDAFAGRTTMMAEITDNPGYKVGLPTYNEVLRLPFFDHRNPRSTDLTVEQLRRHVAENKGNIAALIFEPIQGEGGFRVAPREFFLPLFEICRENNIAIWADEVQTFCRTGQFFAFQGLDLGEYIDVCTIAKTAQVAATLYTEEYNPQPGLIAGTFAGTSAALAAGHEILQILDTEGYMGEHGKIAKIHDEFTAMLNGLVRGSCKGLLSDVGGKGLMVAVTPLDGSKEKMNELLKVLFKNGLMCFGCGHGPYRLRFLIPAVIQSRDIAIAGEIIEKSVHEMS